MEKFPLIAPVLLSSTLALHGADSVSLSHVSSFKTGGFDEGAAEIVAFHPASASAFVVNGEKGSISVINYEDPSNPSLTKDIEVGAYGKDFTCVAIHEDLVRPHRGPRRQAGSRHPRPHGPQWFRARHLRNRGLARPRHVFARWPLSRHRE